MYFVACHSKMEKTIILIVDRSHRPNLSLYNFKVYCRFGSQFQIGVKMYHAICEYSSYVRRVFNTETISYQISIGRKSANLTHYSKSQNLNIVFCQYLITRDLIVRYSDGRSILLRIENFKTIIIIKLRRRYLEIIF